MALFQLVVQLQHYIHYWLAGSLNLIGAFKDEAPAGLILCANCAYGSSHLARNSRGSEDSVPPFNFGVFHWFEDRKLLTTYTLHLNNDTKLDQNSLVKMLPLMITMFSKVLHVKKC